MFAHAGNLRFLIEFKRNLTLDVSNDSSVIMSSPLETSSEGSQDEGNVSLQDHLQEIALVEKVSYIVLV